MRSAKLPARMAKAMEAKSISRADLALALSVSQSAVDRWMTGNRTPKNSMIERIAVVLGVTPQYLAFGVEEPGDAPAANGGAS